MYKRQVAGQIFDPAVGKQIATKIAMNNIEKRAVPVPFLEKKQYFGLHIIGQGNTFIMQMWDGVGFYLVAMDIISGTVLPIYPDPIGVYVSGDSSVVMIAVEQGLALFSSEAIATPGVAQDQLLASAVVWAPPESWAVTISPRAEWMQMYNDAMRNMRDAFYDPNMHGLDWEGITEMYDPSSTASAPRATFATSSSRRSANSPCFTCLCPSDRTRPRCPWVNPARAWAVTCARRTGAWRLSASLTRPASSARPTRP